ncbi:phage protein NinX family protein [Serratia odorifera]|uniref:phage protein NinX family protein n=1 Tax=Serratia odorifera TaxID=618 RepID=UPI003531CE26
MNDYSKMDDRDINTLVDAVTGNRTVGNDYCNNPADAWPIIVENSIVLMPSMRVEKSGLWLCFDVNNSDCDCQDENPLRAAMIVFLMMKAAE